MKCLRLCATHRLSPGQKEMAAMPVRREDYHGLIIRAGAFQVGHAGRYLPALSIERAAEREFPSATALLDPPCPPQLYETADEALDEAIEFGKAVIDGKVPAVDTDSLKAITRPGNGVH
jgi:hypothetical protein